MQPEFEPPHYQPQHVRMLRAIRRQRNWSQAQLAHQLNVSRRTIQYWESERKEPPTYLLAALRELLLTASGATIAL